MSDAQSLSARGLSVIPVPRPRPGARLGEPGDGKIPAIAWREYQTRLPTAAELEQLDGTALDPLKIAAIFVLTEEIVRFARPGADVLLRDVLARQLARFADAQFIDPSVAAVSNISPASITNALTPLASTGDPGFDANNLIIEYVSNGGSLERAAFVLSSQNAVAMRLSGNDLFSDLTRSGGAIAGIPAVASDAVGSILVLLDTARVLLADDGQLAVDASRNTSIEMSDAPSSHAGTTGSSLVSMFQTDSVATKAERYINWIALTGAAAYTEDALYLSGGIAGIRRCRSQNPNSKHC